MKNIAVIFWSGTGNTQAMAEAIAEGAKTEKTFVTLVTAGAASIDIVKNADAVALGCPSMGNETLEEIEMEPLISEAESFIQQKACVLFGSYGWGNGQWMRDWEDRMKACGGMLIADGLIINGTPDETGLQSCRALGKLLAEHV